MGKNTKSNVTTLSSFELLSPIEQKEEMKARISSFDNRERTNTSFVLWSKTEISEAIVRIEQGIIDTEKAIARAENGYLAIINDLVMLEKSATPYGSKGGVMIEGEKYSSFKVFCEKKFGMSKSTFYNLKKIWDRFTDESGKVPEQIKEIGQRPLLRWIDLEIQAEQQAQEEAKKALEEKQKEEKTTSADTEMAANSGQTESKTETPKEKKVAKQRIFSSWKELVSYVMEETWEIAENADIILTLKE